MLVILSKDALKQYEHIRKNDQQKIKKKLYILQENPTAGKKLSGEFKGIRSYRVWPYRILYEINISQQRIEVIKIAHRQSAYT
jgi:addiction module RelE/StbE family toxin